MEGRKREGKRDILIKYMFSSKEEMGEERDFN